MSEALIKAANDAIAFLQMDRFCDAYGTPELREKKFALVRELHSALAAAQQFAPSLIDPEKQGLNQTQAEPVAWMSWTAQYGHGYWESRRDADLHSDPDYQPVPLYTHPPRPAVQLTADEVKIAIGNLGLGTVREMQAARAVEAAVLRKNNLEVE